MKRTDFSYDLPHELIAQEPRPRGRSRMMVVSPAGLEHRSFADFPSQLNAGDVLVLNDTRVIPARLFARPKEGMSRSIEVLLTRQIPSESSGSGWPGGAQDEPTGAAHPPVTDAEQMRTAQPPRSRALARDERTTQPPRSHALARDQRDVWEAWAKPAKRVKPGDVLTFSDTLCAHVLAKNEGTVT